MKEMCKWLGRINMALGLIGGFFISRNAGIASGSISHGEAKINLFVMFAVFVGIMIETAIISCMLWGISEILESLDFLKFRARKEDEQAYKARHEEEKNANSWKCPDCGKSNPQYVGTCSCGRSKK